MDGGAERIHSCRSWMLFRIIQHRDGRPMAKAHIGNQVHFAIGFEAHRPLVSVVRV